MDEINIKIENVRNEIEILRKNKGIRASFTNDIRNDIIYLMEHSNLHKYDLAKRLNVSKVALTKIHNKYKKSREANISTYNESSTNLNMVEIDDINYLGNLLKNREAPILKEREPSLKITTKTGNVIEIY